MNNINSSSNISNSMNMPPKAAATNGTSPAAGNRGNNQPGYEPIGTNGTHNGNNRYSPTTMANNAANLSANQTYDIPVGATTDNLDPGVLYQVKASYKYQAEDVDELNFEVGEVIDVVEYDDPEEQEDGWLMGIKKETGQKGMFPANFTRPV